MVRTACPSCARRRTRSWRRWTSASTTTRRSAGCTAGRGPAADGLQRRAGRRVVHVQPLRRRELRAADRQLPRDRRRPCRPSLLPPQPHLPADVRLGWLETQPSGETRTYLGVDVYEGGYDYRGMHVVPSWGGDMFEALMARLFVPKERGARARGRQPPALRARADRARPPRGAVRLLGLLAQDNPSGGYSAYGVDAIGMQTPTATRPTTTPRWSTTARRCRPARPDPPASAYTNGVVTPHASFLALATRRTRRSTTSRSLRSHFDVYGKGGFYDAVNVGNSGRVARSYLALDQGMVMARRGQRARGRQTACGELASPRGARSSSAGQAAAGDGAVRGAWASRRGGGGRRVN